MRTIIAVTLTIFVLLPQVFLAHVYAGPPAKGFQRIDPSDVIFDSIEQKIEYLKFLAEQGDADAQNKLGLMYHNGEGVPKDYTEAARWFRKVAEQGVADAQNKLGFMYHNGEGVPKDDTEAAKWYRKAAEQDNADAQFNLGVMYATGGGVMRSGAAAADWYYKAGISYLINANREKALTCVERIKELSSVLRLTVPNSFLADKLLTRIYGKGSEQASPLPPPPPPPPPAVDYTLKINALQNLLKSNPNNVEALVQLGNAYFDSNQYQDSINSL